MLPETGVKTWLEIAKEAVCSAGAFLSEHKQLSKRVNAELGRDIKIAADTESERIIFDCLKKKSNFSILSEESGLISGADQEFTWIVDPLDGTLNYKRGIPLSCISIGLWQKDTPVLGAVYDFNRFELFTGIADIGAWLNDVSVKVSNTAQKSKAVLCSGFPVNTDFSSDGIQKFIEDVRSYKKIRFLGSAALSIAYVAIGRSDVYYEKDIMLWDVAGGLPILLGAGGKLNMEKASKEHSCYLYASNGCL